MLLFVGVVAMLPSGLGGTEISMVGLLTAMGLDLETAITATANRQVDNALVFRIPKNAQSSSSSLNCRQVSAWALRARLTGLSLPPSRQEL